MMMYLTSLFLRTRPIGVRMVALFGIPVDVVQIALGSALKIAVKPNRFFESYGLGSGVRKK